MGRRRRDKNHSPKRNNSTQDSVGNKENEYPVPDHNKTMINVTEELSNTHIKTLQKEIFNISLRNSWRRY
jgi:hypothetical protein